MYSQRVEEWESWLIQLGRISYGTIMLYRATIFCKQNRILHPIMDHQLALLVRKKKYRLLSEVRSMFWFCKSPWIFLARSSQFVKMQWSGWRRRSPWAQLDAALCGVSLMPPMRALEGSMSTSPLDTALLSLNPLPPSSGSFLHSPTLLWFSSSPAPSVRVNLALYSSL